MPQDSTALTATINKKTVPVLKEMLTERGLSTSGLKAVLVSRLVKALIKEESKSDGGEEKIPSKQDIEETTTENISHREQSPSSEEEAEEQHTKSGEERGKSPINERSPSPVRKEEEEHHEVESPARESKSPTKEETPSPRKERSPSPPRNKEKSKKESKEDDSKKRKEQEASTTTNGAKRQRKWVSKGQNDINISSDTLDDMLTDSRAPDALSSSASSARPQESARVVVRKEKEKEKEKESTPGERVVPPARKPESRTLFIDRFVRPFMPKHARELLEKTGEVEYFWMNNIRSHCYVTFKTVEQAKATREAVYNLVWPPANNSRLIAEFSTEEEAARRAEVAKARETAAQQPQAVPQPRPTNLTRSSEKVERPDKEKERDSRDRLDRGRERVDRDRRDDRGKARAPPPPKVTLETLFRKTQARPSIYWLPLTDKEIEDKKANTTTATATATATAKA